VIGILELGGGYDQSDLDLFSQLNGLPPIQVTDISVDGGQNPGYTGTTLADIEVALDIEIAAATYFYATGEMPQIKVLFCPDGTDTNQFVDVFAAAVANDCDVLSISWGYTENLAAFTVQYTQDIETAAQAATDQGLTIFAATGDTSSSDGRRNGRHVTSPACCPHVVACGGTTKRPGGSVEIVWGDGNVEDTGTGGGYSKVFPVQSFQVGAPRGPGRMLPDVAANANPYVGILFVAGGVEAPEGGTSAVAPLYSGLFASFGRKLGFVSPTLWQNPQAFVDIILGSNGYHARVGPDPCTGLGVPNGAAIAALFNADSNAAHVSVVGLKGSTGQVALPRTKEKLFSVRTGKGAGALIGDFAAMVIEPKALRVPAFSDAPSVILGVGSGATKGGLNMYGFTGRR